ncbi:hypothetical protein BU17DRAFT_62024 [Hysterangium stoloniferum]|nr:hypothetical protein BU17DRAFT_62024 [Hysterangium stoloniferum]
MLDSSPLPAPPPRKLKRTASVASLPSPPPSVQPPKKRANSQKFDSDADSESEGDDAEDEEEGAVVGRKLLFPTGPSTSSLRAGTDDDPFSATSSRSSKDTSSSRPDAPASPRSKHKVSGPTRSPRTPPPVERRGRCLPAELPTLDEDENPFIGGSLPKPRRAARPPVDITERPTLTYVFKGIKTSLPNPNYHLPQAVYERARLPLYHPDYSPLPVYRPKRLFQEAHPNAGVEDDAEGDFNVEFCGDGEEDDDELRTPDGKPRMAKYFVDAAGNPLPDSGPQGVRGKTMDALEIGRMAVGPPRPRG